MKVITHYRLYGTFAFVLLLLSSSIFGQGQPNNAGQYHVEVRTNGFNYGGLCGGTSLLPMLPTFLFKTAPDVNNTSDYLMTFVTNQPAGQDVCHNWSFVPGIEGPITSDTHNELLYLAISTFNPKYDIEVQKFSNNPLAFGDFCVFGTSILGDDCHHDRFKELRNPVENGNANQWNDRTITFPLNANTTIQSAWRHAYGDAETSPLTFGTINLNERSHTNSNRSAPAGSQIFMGYNSALGPSDGTNYEGSPDVFYQFEIINNAKRVQIFTDNANFDTKLHILFLDVDGTYRYLASSCSNCNFVSADLGAGTYLAVVEGEGDETGDFRINIPAPDAAIVEGGTISQPSSPLCAGSDWPAIFSLLGAGQSTTNSVNLGLVTYQWQYMDDLDTEWSDISNSTGGTLPAGREDLDRTTMFRRKATLAGNVGYSNIVTVTAEKPTPGIINLVGDNIVDPGQDPGSIGSTVDATSVNGSLFYSWFKSTNGAVWNNVFGGNNPTYDIPPLTQTTWYRRDVTCAFLGPSNSSNILKIYVEEDFNCDDAIPISCDQTLMGDNTWGLTNSDLLCSFAATAPAVIYTFQATAGEQIEIKLTEINADLDLFVLDACDPSTCLSTSRLSGTSDESIIITPSTSTTHYIVVDGFGLSVSSFSLNVVCSTSNCDMDITLTSPDNDFNGTDVNAFLTNETIIASNKIQGMADITYDADKGTRLEINFQVDPGASLQVLTDGCP